MLFALIVFHVGGVVSVDYDSTSIVNLPIDPYPGEPALPIDLRRFNLPSGASNVRLVVDEIVFGEQVDLPIDFNDTIRIIEEEGDSIIPLIRISHPAPIILEGYGRSRDKTIAIVRINPLYFDGNSVRRIERVSFHLEWDESPNSVEALEDSLDYLILTLSRFHPYVDSIAFLARLRGLRTLIVDIDSIAFDPVAIRNLIKYYYRNFGIRYASIVGHGSIVSPFLLRFHPDSVVRWVYPTGPLVYTDFPYMALDGEYYSSRDQFVGDNDDGTDVVPDIGFSRIPVTNLWELEEYYAKLKRNVFGDMDNFPGSVTCLESRLDSDTSTFAWLCESALGSIDVPRVQRMYEPYFDYDLDTREFFDSLNTLRPQIFIYMGHSNIDRILTNYYPRRDIMTYKYYLFMEDYFIPFAYIGGCWPGDIMSSAMAQNLSRMERRGALFSFASSKFDYASNESMKARYLLEGFFELNYYFAADVMNYVREPYMSHRYFLYSIQSFGDPTSMIFVSPPSPLPASHNSAGDILTIDVPDSTYLSIFSRDGQHLRYFLPHGDTSIPLRLFHPETLLVSVWKPGYAVDTFRFIYVPQDVVVDRPYIDAEELAFGGLYELSIPLMNYSEQARTVSLHIDGEGFSPSSIDTNIALNPHEYTLLRFPIEPDNGETFTLSLFLDGQTIGRFKFRVQEARFYITGVKWTADSVLLDVYNASAFPLYGVRLFSWYGGATFDIPSGLSTGYTIGIPVPPDVDTIHISLNWNGYSIRKKLVRAEVYSEVDSLGFASRIGGLEIYIYSMDSVHRYKVYFRRGAEGEYSFAGLTDTGSRVFYFSTSDYGQYCFRVSPIDRWYNEGEMSEEYCNYPSPVHGEVLPISMEGWFFSQPVVGQFDATTPQREIFAITNVHYGFFNFLGEPYPGYPKRLLLEVRSKPVVLDLDGDGMEEVVASGKSLLNNRVYLLSFHIEGAIDTLYSSDHPYDFPLYGGLLAQDVDGDSLPEIIMKNYYGYGEYAPRIMVFEGDTLVFQWFLNGDDFNYIVPSAGDIDGDGRAEILFVDEDGFLYALRVDSTNASGFPIDLNGYFSGGVRYSQVIGLDSILIAVIFTNSNSAYAIVVDLSGNVISSALLTSGSVMYEWKHAAVGFLDGDSIPDIVLSSRDSLVISNIYGDRLAPSIYEYLLGPYTMPSPIIADVGLDGKPEIIYTNASMLKVLTLDGGNLTEYPGFPLILADDSTMDFQGLFSPFIADMDGDGIGEIFVAANRLSYIYQIQEPPTRVIWGEEYFNKWNTGWYGFYPPEPPVLRDERETTENMTISFDPRFSTLLLRFQLERREEFQIDIYDIGGRLRKSYRGFVSGRGVRRMDVSELPSGVYLVHGRVGRKVVKFSFVRVR